MRPLALRATLAGAAALACTITSSLARAQGAGASAPEAAPQPPPAAGADRSQLPPPRWPPSLFLGAPNQAAAERALRLERAAAELERARPGAANAADLLAQAKAAKLEAFHLAEFAQTRDAASRLSAEAELRRSAAEKKLKEATARHEQAKAVAEKRQRDPADATEREEARAELAKRKAELEAAQRSRDKTLEAAHRAGLAASHAGDALDAANVAVALADAFAGAMKEAGDPDENERARKVESATDMKKISDENKVRAFDDWVKAREALDEYRRLSPAVDAAEQSARLTPPPSDSETLDNGVRLSWGITGSLLRFQTQRSENLPGRNRNYRPRYEFVPGEAGFQFLVEPASSPWRLRLKNGNTHQLMSWGGLMLASLGEDKALERGSLSLGATLVFFDKVIGLGGGFDLYRGIPVRGADGTPGGDTAFTGVLAWAFAQEGEVTAENAFVVVTINLSSLIGALTGKDDGDAN